MTMQRNRHAPAGDRGPTLRPQVRTPQEVVTLVTEMTHFEQEHLRVLLLNTKNRLLRSVELYVGTLTGCSVRVGEIFREAIRENAAAILLVHNHPSGDPAPSPQDVELTRGVVLAGTLLDIDVLDHIVIGCEGHVSLKEQGLGFPTDR